MMETEGGQQNASMIILTNILAYFKSCSVVNLNKTVLRDFSKTTVQCLVQKKNLLFYGKIMRSFVYKLFDQVNHSMTNINAINKEKRYKFLFGSYRIV